MGVDNVALECLFLIFSLLLFTDIPRLVSFNLVTLIFKLSVKAFTFVFLNSLVYIMCNIYFTGLILRVYFKFEVHE